MSLRRFVPQGLAAHTAALLFVAFVVLQVTVLALLWQQVGRPLAVQSADDLAGRLVLAAQTWVELPPETRADFEDELASRHGIHIRMEPLAPAAVAGGLDGLVAQALSQRLRVPVKVVALDAAHAGFDLRIGGYTLSLGYTRPQALARAGWILGAVMLGGGLLTVLLAVWLTRRIAERLRQLARHAAAVGEGGAPAPLSETGEAELVLLTAQMNRLVDEVQGLLANRTMLLAGISHDLRTPLTRIRLALSLLEDTAPERVERIAADVREMDSLIGEMLALARDLRTEAVAELVWSDWLAEFVTRWPEGAVRCTVQGMPTARLASRALMRILANLVENALRYGAAPVEVAVTTDAEGWRVAVSDRGPGIPAEQREAVFRPFYRLEMSRDRSSGGAGLGLTIARQLAQAQGWRISLDEREGGGLVATLTGT
jgi:two-component system osmolarity sensor histidine kinase EnvZ